MTTTKRIIACILLAATASPPIIDAFAPASPVVRPATRLSAAGVNDVEYRRALVVVVNNNRLTANAASLSSVLLAATLLLAPLPSHADGSTKDFKLPPIDYSDKSRCVLNSSKMRYSPAFRAVQRKEEGTVLRIRASILLFASAFFSILYFQLSVSSRQHEQGQANAARDKLYDLRECQLSGVRGNEFDLSGVIMSKTDVSKAMFREAQFSKGYLRDSNFDGADFTNAIVDRANFKGSSLRGAIFKNAVLTATSFEGADVENADFTDAYIGDFDIRNLCRNPTLKGENPTTGADARLSANCRD
ncbi:hypothetical protein ACHAW5_004968 [Stephanodiscus triporus]|uniref:Pentapeptide repeat-containing protein n=1 Tax=Stephanodiscus triporus TaxID=2934178 RepID=A0ABD3MYX5_9STRA